MATTNIHPTMQHRRHERQQQNSNYAIVWGLIVAALIAAIAYGYYASERSVLDPSEINATQASVVTPVDDGTTSSMVGTGPASNELTPSTTAPGTPDTTTTESSSVPTQGIQ